MFERVLVPLDGSELGEAALPVVQRMLGNIRADLYLLRVVTAAPIVVDSEDGWYRTTAAEPSITAAEAEAYLRQLAGKLRRPDLSVIPVVRSGEPASQIVDVANEHDINVIVMSTHGRTGLARLMMGSVTEHVMRKANRPVLVVRPPAEKPVARPAAA